MSLSLVTDRTQSDVDTANRIKTKRAAGGWSNLTTAEQTAFLAGLKGSYNYTDLNRVGAAVAYLAGFINGYGYTVSVAAKTSWAQGEVITPADAAVYITDVAAIKAAFYGTTNLPTAMSGMTYAEANNIETLLLEVESYINQMIAGFRRCGNATCGQGVFL